MTIDQFNTASFGAGDRAIYDGQTYPIASVDFKESLIGLIMKIEGGDPDEVTWVRCENVTYLSPLDF